MITITGLAVHPEGTDPTDQQCISVRLDDEGAGPFLVIEQGGAEVRIDFDEVPAVFKAVNRLRRQRAVMDST